MSNGGNLELFTVEEYFAGAHAFDTINFIISILKAVVAFIAVFVAWSSDNIALPNVDFDVMLQMDAVFRFLGVAPRPTTSDFVKTSRNNLSNKIENYKEVRQALRGTPWEIP